MKILFSTHFDNPTFPVNTFLRDGVAAGCRHMGPAGLLSFLELHLGVTGPSESNVLRVFKYRKALKKTAGGAFFEKSFSANELDVAEELLSWRDQLRLAGWNFTPEKEMPVRLRAMAGAEALAGVADAYGDRFRIVLDMLKTGVKVPLDELIYFEPLVLLPPHIAALIRVMEHIGVGCSQFIVPAIPGDGSDLSSLRSFILSTTNTGARKSEVKGDGSLKLLMLPNRLQAGDLLAGLIRNQDCSDVVLISENNEIQPFLGLMKDGFPSPSVTVNDPVPSGVCLLQILTVFLWKPWQPHQLFEFFQCPVSLLPPYLSRLLARAMSEKPGIGSESWQNALGKYRESVEEEQFIRAISRLNYLLELEKYDAIKGAPVSVIRGLFEFAVAILRGRLARLADGMDKELLLPVVIACSNLLSILSIFEEDEVIGDLELKRIIEKSIISIALA